MLPALLRDLEVAFVTDAERAKSALAAGMNFNLIHRTTYLKVDLFPCDNAFNRQWSSVLGVDDLLTSALA